MTPPNSNVFPTTQAIYGRRLILSSAAAFDGRKDHPSYKLTKRNARVVEAFRDCLPTSTSMSGVISTVAGAPAAVGGSSNTPLDLVIVVSSLQCSFK